MAEPLELTAGHCHTARSFQQGNRDSSGPDIRAFGADKPWITPALPAAGVKGLGLPCEGVGGSVRDNLPQLLQEIMLIGTVRQAC